MKIFGNFFEKISFGQFLTVKWQFCGGSASNHINSRNVNNSHITISFLQMRKKQKHENHWKERVFMDHSIPFLVF